MPVTLAQAQVNVQDDVAFAVIDDLRRYSWLLDRIVFDDTVNPTGGTTLTYGYTRLVTPRTAAFRALNTEYVPGQAVRQRYNVDLKPHGGAFELDRVLAHLGQRATDEATFQVTQLTTAVHQKFQEELINGDIAVDANGFDGLDKILTGASTEYDPLTNGTATGYLNWSASAITTQALAMAALDQLDEMLAKIILRRPAAETSALPVHSRPARRRSSATRRASRAFGRWPAGQASTPSRRTTWAARSNGTARGCWSTSATGRPAHRRSSRSTAPTRTTPVPAARSPA